MSLISQTMKNLKGGTSQQPDILRYPEQGAAQVNCFSSEVDGLIKRPPLVLHKRLSVGGLLGNAPMCHLIHRDSEEQYMAIFDGVTIRVLDLKAGVYRNVGAPAGVSYITTQKPQEDIRCVTVADYTFVINTKLACEQGTGKTTRYYELDRHCLIVCSGGQYSRKFTITINDAVAAEYQTPDGTDPLHGAECDIKFILQRLKEDFDRGLGQQGWACSQREGYLWISAPADDPIVSLKVTDGYNGKLLTGFKYDVKSTTELPVYAPDNYQVRVSGESGTDQDDYWVQFDATRNVWTEAAAPDIANNYRDSTMPHILVREFNTDGTPKFVLKQATWTKRAAGDDETNPYPSFIGQALTDVFFFRNRLGFLAGENVILSESGAYFNFFPPSVAVTADSDPIDVAVSANRVSILKYAVPFAEELLLWADQNQFVLGADGILSPTSVKLDLTTEFEVVDNARPFGIGRNVYFMSERSDFTSVRRYYAVQDVSAVRDAEDVTAHVPRYIPNGVHGVNGSGTENFLSVITHGAPHHIYLYKFLYKEEQVYQQAWGHWDLGEGNRVLSCPMIGSQMYVLLDTEHGIYLLRTSFESNTKDFAGEPYRLHLDYKTQYTIPASAYDADDFSTTIQLRDVYGATPTEGDFYLVLTDGTTILFPEPDNGWLYAGGVLQITGDLTGQLVTLGSAFNMHYEFSKLLIKKQAQDGSIATEDSGRLQLRRAWVNYERSGSFVISVDNRGNKGTYRMTGKRLGSSESLVGFKAQDTGQFRFPLAGNAKNTTVTLDSSTPNPVSITGAGWEGNYVRRSNGI